MACQSIVYKKSMSVIGLHLFIFMFVISAELKLLYLLIYTHVHKTVMSVSTTHLETWYWKCRFVSSWFVGVWVESYSRITPVHNFISWFNGSFATPTENRTCFAWTMWLSKGSLFINITTIGGGLGKSMMANHINGPLWIIHWSPVVSPGKWPVTWSFNVFLLLSWTAEHRLSCRLFCR